MHRKHAVYLYLTPDAHSSPVRRKPAVPTRCAAARLDNSSVHTSWLWLLLRLPVAAAAVTAAAVVSGRQHATVVGMSHERLVHKRWLPDGGPQPVPRLAVGVHLQVGGFNLSALLVMLRAQATLQRGSGTRPHWQRTGKPHQVRKVILQPARHHKGQVTHSSWRGDDDWDGQVHVVRVDKAGRHACEACKGPMHRIVRQDLRPGQQQLSEQSHLNLSSSALVALVFQARLQLLTCTQSEPAVRLAEYSASWP